MNPLLRSISLAVKVGPLWTDALYDTANQRYEEARTKLDRIYALFGVDFPSDVVPAGVNILATNVFGRLENWDGMIAAAAVAWQSLDNFSARKRADRDYLKYYLYQTLEYYLGLAGRLPELGEFSDPVEFEALDLRCVPSLMKKEFPVASFRDFELAATPAA